MDKKTFYEDFCRKVSMSHFKGISLSDEFKSTIYNAIKTTPLIRQNISYILFGSADYTTDYRCCDILANSQAYFIVFGKTIKRSLGNGADIRYKEDLAKKTIVLSRSLYDAENPEKLSFVVYKEQEKYIPGIDIGIGGHVLATVHRPGIINIHIENLFQEQTRIWHDLKLLSEILKQAFFYLSLPEDKFYYQIYSGDVKQFRNAIAKSVESKIKASRAAIKDINNEIEKATQTIIEKKEQLLIEAKKIAAYETIVQDTLQKIYEEAEFVNNIAGVKKVDLYGQLSTGIISIFTDNIYVNNQRSRYLMGEYKIEIDIINGAVSFLNQNRDLRRQSYWGEKCHHPHCSESGKPCLGNIQIQVAELISSFDLSFLVNLCISYLSSVNINDAAGRHIVNWPLVDKDGKVIDNTGNPEGLISCKKCGDNMPDEDNEGWHKCDICGEWHCEKHIQTISVQGESKHVCAECIYLFKECSVCGEYHMLNSMSKCELCDSYICADCLEEYENQPPVYLSTGRKVGFYCKNHNIEQCSKCGLNILSGSDCPQCNDIISVKQCSICGDEIINGPFDSGNVGTVTSPLCHCCLDKVAMCSFCGQYDLRERLYYDSVLNIYKHEICPTGTTEDLNQGE